MTSEINVIDPVKLVTLEQIDETIFSWRHAGSALGACVWRAGYRARPCQCLQDCRRPLCHSLHAYFLRPGDPEMPIVFHVDEARDGGSFTNRRVVAIQRVNKF